MQIGLKDGRMVRGWLRCYSDEAEDSTFFLEAATWVGDDGNQYPVNGPGILFTKESGIQFVMFLNELQGPQAATNIWPKWYTSTVIAVFLVGIWTLLNITLSLIEYLWRAYYVR